MRPLEALAAVAGIYTSMLFLTARNVRAAAAETWSEVQRRAALRRRDRRPIDF